MPQFNWLISLDADNKAKKKKKEKEKKKGWLNFHQPFPNADLSQFVAQVAFDEKQNASAQIHFKAGGGFAVKRFRLRQEILEPSDKKGVWFNRCRR